MQLILLCVESLQLIGSSKKKKQIGVYNMGAGSERMDQASSEYLLRL